MEGKIPIKYSYLSILVLQTRVERVPQPIPEQVAGYGEHYAYAGYSASVGYSRITLRASAIIAPHSERAATQPDEAERRTCKD